MAIAFATEDKSAECILTPSDTSVVGTIEHEVQGRWAPPNDPAKGFSGSPTGGANEITLAQEWDDLQIRVRENLLEKIVETVESALNQLPQALTGEIAQAILAFATQLEKLVRDEFRELIVPWSCTFTAPLGCNLGIVHSMDYRSTVHSTFSGSGQAQRMTWRIDARVFLNDRPLQRLRITHSGQATEAETIEKLDLGMARGQDTLRAIARIRLESAGFYTELEALVLSLIKIAEEAAKLSETLDAYMRNWVREQIDWYWDWFQALAPNAMLTPSEDAQAAERARKKAELEQRIRDGVRRLVDEFRRIFRDLISQWHGVIKIDRLTYTVTCLSEAGRRKATEYLLHSGEEQSKQSDGLIDELRESLLRTDTLKEGLRAGETVIPKAIWDAVGLDGSKYVLAIAGREKAAALETKIAQNLASRPKRIAEGVPGKSASGTGIEALRGRTDEAL